MIMCLKFTVRHFVDVSIMRHPINEIVLYCKPVQLINRYYEGPN